MEFGEYQEKASKTAIYPNRQTLMGLMYATLKLNGEAGEIAEKVGKMYRDRGSIVSQADIVAIQKELGDVLWYISAICDELGIYLNEVAQGNLDKLADRAKRGVLGGSGDER